MVSSTRVSRMMRTQPGNRQGILPARMVGRSLCLNMRYLGTEAERVEKIRGGILDGIPPYFLFVQALVLFFFMGVSFAQGTNQLKMPTRGIQYQVKNHQVYPTRIDDPTPEELSAAKGLESLLVDQLVQEMRKTVHESDLMPASHGEKVYRQMLDSEYSRMLGDSGMLGISDLVIAEMRGRK